MTAVPVHPRRHVLRVLVAALVLIAWVVLARVGGPAFGSISSVTNNDQASYLPASAESTAVQSAETTFFGSDSTPATVLLVRSRGLRTSDRSVAAAIAERLRDVPDVTGVSPAIPSEDGAALELIAQVRSSADGATVVAAMRAVLTDHSVAGLDGWVTGPAALGADFGAGFAGIDGTLLLVALAAVFVILLVVYRSLMLPVVVLLTSAFALTGSILVVYAVASAGWVTVTGQSRGILAILAIGAATDYSLLLVARFREALLVERSRWAAIRIAWRRAIAPVGASAATVILAVLCLGFSDLNSNRGLGPVAAIAVAFAFLAAVTALPAALALIGRAAFWPFVPRPRPGAEARPSASWRRVGALVDRRPRILWVGVALLLGVLAIGLTGLKASGVPQTDLLLTPSQSVAGQKELAKHFAAGSGSPVIAIVPQADRSAALTAIERVAHVESASLYAGSFAARGGTPTVRDGRVLVQATLDVAADSDAAQAAVASMRQRLAVAAPGSEVGGTSAIALDSNDAAQRDLRVVIPIVLAVILVVLILLLRALVAPLVLIATVALSYAATLGLAAVVFDHVLRFPGADPSVPLFGFVFLVALGVDYNIFLMTRAREEAVHVGHRQGVVTGLERTGGVITSAGVVLAATFAALGTIPILFLVQIAFIVAAGVLIDTLLVRTLLVPGLAIDIGRRFWWPSRLGRA